MLRLGRLLLLLHEGKAAGLLGRSRLRRCAAEKIHQVGLHWSRRLLRRCHCLGRGSLRSLKLDRRGLLGCGFSLPGSTLPRLGLLLFLGVVA